jgi:hypothetical protein
VNEPRPLVVQSDQEASPSMTDQTWWETTKIQGDRLIETVKRLVHEGNVRRIVIKQGDETIAEFPLSAGVVGAVFAPVLAAVGALAALVKDCTIAVERAAPVQSPAPAEPPAPVADTEEDAPVSAS